MFPRFCFFFVSPPVSQTCLSKSRQSSRALDWSLVTAVEQEFSALLFARHNVGVSKNKQKNNSHYLCISYYNIDVFVCFFVLRVLLPPRKDVVCGGLRLGQVEIHLVCVGRECTFYLKLRAWWIPQLRSHSGDCVSLIYYIRVGSGKTWGGGDTGSHHRVPRATHAYLKPYRLDAIRVFSSMQVGWGHCFFKTYS